MQLALGLIETKGLIGAIEAADAATKSANVKLIAKEYSTGALVLVKFEGEVAAVKAAVDAGAAAAQRVGQLVSAHVIARPDDQIDAIIYESSSSQKDSIPLKFENKSVKKEKSKEKSASLFDTNEDKKAGSVLEEPLVIDEITAEYEKEEVVEDVKDLKEVEDNEVQKEEVIEEELVVDNEKELEANEDVLLEEKKLADAEEENIEKIKEVRSIPPMSELEILNVHQLRKLARSYDNFPIKGRDISKANRGTLLDLFKTL